MDGRMPRLGVDPRRGQNSKWWLKPIDEHKYDVLFLERGRCELEFDERELMDLAEKMQRHIEKCGETDYEKE